MARNPSRHALLVAAVLVATVALFAFLPPAVHAAPTAQPIPLPTWLQDMIDQLEATLVKALQDSARLGGVMLWGVLKVCGMVGLFGADFSALFGHIITEALNAVLSGQLHALIRGSLMVSLGIFGLSLLARPFWPDVRLVSFQRAALWGIAIQAYLLNAPTLYTTLETWRVDLAEQVAGAVSTGAIPGCSGDVVEVLLCITGTSPGDVLEPSLTALPEGIPYGGSESVRDLYDHCVYNPPFLYGHPLCSPDLRLGDPWEVLEYAQDALGVQLLSIIVGLLILAFGVLQIALGLAAGMMFVLFPVAAIFAFYLPLESFPAGVIRNYINIFLKSVVLLTLAGVVIRLFSVASGSLTGMAAVALVDLVLCLVMAKEALASLLTSISFVGSSVGSLGMAVGQTGSGGGMPAPSAESRVAASMIGGGTVAQTVMGAPHPYGGSGGEGGLLGAAGRAAGAPARGARAAVQAAITAGSGGAGAVLGAVAAARGSDHGGLALMGNAAGSILGRSAGRGFTIGAGAATALGRGAAAKRQSPRHDASVTPAAATSARLRQSSVEPSAEPASRPSAATPARPSLLVPAPPSAPPAAATGRMTAAAANGQMILPADPATGAPASIAALQGLLLGAGAIPAAESLSAWAPESAQQIRGAATRLEPASPGAENAVVDLARTGHGRAAAWQRAGRSPVLADGSLDPQLVEEVVGQEPVAAGALLAEQTAANLPDDQRLSLGEAVALGVTTQRTIPAQQVRRGFGRAVKAMGPSGDLNTALQAELGAGVQPVFGSRASQAEEVTRQMQAAGLANEPGRQLVETVQEGLERDPRLTVQQFRERRLSRMRQWDRATGDPETTDRIVDGLIGLGAVSPVTVYEIPRPPAAAAAASAAQGPVASAVPAQPATVPPSPTAPAPTVAAPASSRASARRAPRVAAEPGPAPVPQHWQPHRAEPSGQPSAAALAAEPAAPAPIPHSAPVPQSDPPVQAETAQPAEPPTQSPQPPAPAAQAQPYDPALFAQLRAWRAETAQQQGQKAFYVFSDATLKSVAAARPQTPEELRAIRGVGPKKLELYGPAVLEITRRPGEEEV